MGKNYGKITQQIDAKLQAAKIKIKPCCIVNDAWLTIKPCQIVTFLCICLQWCKLTLYDYLLIPQKLSFFARERERERETERQSGTERMDIKASFSILLFIFFLGLNSYFYDNCSCFSILQLLQYSILSFFLSMKFFI